MRCEEARSLLSEYLDGMLDEEAGLKVKLHIKECAVCMRQYDDMLEERRLIGLMAGIGPSAGFTERVMSTIRESLNPYLVLPVPLMGIFALVFMGLAMGQAIYRLLSIYLTVASGVITSVLKVYSNSIFVQAEIISMLAITMIALIFLFDRLLKGAGR
ncbi:MAG: zf-HC2 domain-containing protein [Thermoanaerobacteraceae bacterium]|nr:zf-HC2 domain-containing protein [Thermoanaerobacteraceae bacterium]